MASEKYGYDPEYYTQGLKEYSGQVNYPNTYADALAKAGGGILSGLAGGVGSADLGKLGFQSVGKPVQKLDILEAAKRKLIRSLVERSPAVQIPEAYYSGLLDLVREYDSEWASFYDSISIGSSPRQAKGY